MPHRFQHSRDKRARPGVLEIYERVNVEGARHRTHRLVAAKALGKSLPKGAVVHHVDENKLNNANTNLVLCEDEAYHQLLHLRLRIRALGGNPNTDHVCGTCGVLPRKEFYNIRTGKYAGSPLSECKACVAVRNKRRKEKKNAACTSMSEVWEQIPLLRT